jgi:D-xylulose kinase
MYFIGIDSGTQSTKALLIDAQGNVCGRGQATHHLIEGLPPQHMEQEPAHWWQALKEAVAAAIKQADVAPNQIKGIGISGQQHGFVPLDAEGAVIRPAKLWCDTSTDAEATAIMEAVGGHEAYHQLIGNSLPAGFTASKILWLKKHEPENFSRLATVLLPHDYLNFMLTGDKRMEWGDASGTGLMSINTRQWVESVIEAIDPRLSECLPHLADSSEPHGRLTPDAATELNLPAGILVAAGGGDNMMGAIGTGNVAQGIATISLGTSGTVYAYAEKAISDPNGLIAGFCDSTGAWLPLLCTMNVTVATEVTRSMFGLSIRELENQAGSVNAGCDGLLLLPWFEGERVPNLPNARAAWTGVSSQNSTRAHYARAAMEGASLGLAWGWERMKELGLKAEEFRLTGGGSKSAVWRQILSDMLGTPVVCTREAEGAALGAAIQACWQFSRSETDKKSSVTDLTESWVGLDESSRCLPDETNRGIYDEMLERFGHLVNHCGFWL